MSREQRLAHTRVSQQTREAFDDVVSELRVTGASFRLRSAAKYAGHIQTRHGKFEDVIKRELER